MTLNLFLEWLGNCLSSDLDPTPETQLGGNPALDDFAMLQLVGALDELVGSEASVASAVYELETCRQLYLYYLFIMSVPPPTFVPRSHDEQEY